MGLIVSMKRITGEIKDISKNISIGNSLFIDLVFECEQDRVSIKLERSFISPEVKNLKVTIICR